MDRQCILITGGTGFIGMTLAEHLAMQGHDIVLFDCRPPRTGSHLDGAFRAYMGDTRSREDLAKVLALNRFDGIVHLAAVSRVVSAKKDPALCHATNVDGTRNLIELAGKHKDLRWFIFGSSREVYGEPAELPVPEDSSKMPINAYGRSKLAAENIVERLSWKRQIGCVSLRFSNVYGNGHDIPDRVVPKFIARTRAGLPVDLEGGLQVHDFTHIDDTVAAIVSTVRLMDCMENGYEAINVVTGRGTSISELASIVSEALGRPCLTRVVPPRRYDVTSFIGDPAKASDMLGFRASVDIRSGIQMAVGRSGGGS